MHGQVVVRAAALSSTAAVSTRRVVSGCHLPATLRDKHLDHDGHSATTRLSTCMFDHHRRSDGHHHTRMPATLRLRSDRQHLDHMPAAMPTGHRNEQHNDDRLPTAMPGEHCRRAHDQPHRARLSCPLPAPLHGR
jgi:hypothetical protein